MIKKPLQELFESMYHGKLSFEHFLNGKMSENYTVELPKSPGHRTICKPKKDLKAYHKFLNLFLFERLPINEEVVFSYRKGFGARDAVDVHKNAKYFFQTDIQSFFQSIDSTLVRAVIHSGVEFCAVSDIDKYMDRIIELVCIDDSLPIGFPASAPLSNAVLYQFDNRMEKICSELELTYSRYADDIIVSGQTKGTLLAMDCTVQSNLHAFSSKKFFINKKKTRHFQVGGKVKILGIMILPNGTISADTKKKKELEVLLHFYLTNKRKFDKMIADIKARSGKVRDRTEDAGQEILSGNINYVDSIDPTYTNKLRRKFGAATIDMLIHKGFNNKK